MGRLFSKSRITPVCASIGDAFRVVGRWQFYNGGMYDGRFTEKTKPAVVTKAYIAAGWPSRRVPRAARFRSPTSAALASPTQSSGEIDKVVGFPIVDPWLRQRLKALPFNPAALDDELREDLAEHVWNATLQPASTFMNSIRQRQHEGRHEAEPKQLEGRTARRGDGGHRVSLLNLQSL